MIKKRTILITGASSGIGRALAELYAAADTRLLLTGRDPERLQTVADACRQKGADVEGCTTCVTDRAAFEKHITAWDDAFAIDLVIANAGISGGMGKDHVESEDKFRAIIDINLNGTFNTVNPLIPRLEKRKSGQLVLMSSMAGFRGLPSAAAYSVSKNAVRAYAEALRPLLRKNGICVNVICPGFIKTPLTDVNTFPMPFLMSVEKAAQKIKRGIERDRAVIAFPWPMHVLMIILSALPRGLGDWILSQAPHKP